MELIQHEILDTGTSNDFHYYTLISGFDINPNNGDTARDLFMYIRSIISSKAEIQDDIAIRLYKNDLGFGLSQYPSETENMAVTQYLFSVSAHNNSWTLQELSDAIGSAPLSTKMLPRANSVIIEWYKSLEAGMNFSILDDAGVYNPINKWDIKISKSIPDAHDGSDGQLWFVPTTQGFMTYYYRQDGRWNNITKLMTLSTLEPSNGEKYWLDITGMTCRLSDPITTYSEDSYPMMLITVDPSEIKLTHTPHGTTASRHLGGKWEFFPFDGNPVYDKYNWVNDAGTAISNSFTFAEQNAALAGSGGDLSGGAVEIYNYSYDPANLVGTATALVFVDGDQRAYIGGSDPDGIIRVGLAPSYSSHFMTADGMNGNQSFTPITTTNALISDPDDPPAFVAGNWLNTNKPATNINTVTYTTPGIVTGFGVGSTLTVTITDGNNSVIDTVTGEFTTNQTLTNNMGVSVQVTDYTDTDGGNQEAGKITVTIDHVTLLGGSSGTLHVDVTMTAADNGNDYTFTQSYFYDANTSLSPAINGNITLDVNTPLTNTKFLSGIEYLTTDQSFSISALDIDGLSSDTFHPTTQASFNFGVLPIADYSVDKNSSDFIGMTNFYNVSDVDYVGQTLINEPNAVYIGATDVVFSVRDTWTTTPKTLTMPNLLIDTVTETSTSLVENFDGETRRLTDSWTPWDSTATLTAGNALVANNMLMVPTSLQTTVGTLSSASDLSGYTPAGPDYSAIVAPVNYKRMFTFTNRNYTYAELSLTVTGNFGVHSDINEAMNAGDVEIFMYKEADNNGTYPDPSLRNPVWLHANFSTTFYDDGASQDPARSGVRIASTSTGSNIDTTYGTYGLKSGFWLEVVINSNDIMINSITVNE